MANAELRPIKNLQVMACAGSVAVGDLVFQSETVDNVAITCTDNLSRQPVFAVITRKLTSTSCEAKFIGTVPTVLPRGRVFLGVDGKQAAAPPATGYVQHLGISFGNGQMLFRPTLVRTHRAI